MNIDRTKVIRRNTDRECGVYSQQSYGSAHIPINRQLLPFRPALLLIAMTI